MSWDLLPRKQHSAAPKDAQGRTEHTPQKAGGLKDFLDVASQTARLLLQVCDPSSGEGDEASLGLLH